MESALKRKIKRLWQQRLLVTISGVVALGFSVLQLQAVIRYRSLPTSWTLDLAEAIEMVIDANISEDRKEKALVEIKGIAKRRELPITEILAHSQTLALALDQTRDLDLTWDLARARARALDWELTPDLDLTLGLAQTLDLAQVRSLIQVRDQTLTLDLAQGQILIRDRDLAQVRDLDLDLDLMLAQELLHDLHQSKELAQAQALSKELVQTLEQAQIKFQSPLIVLVVSAELENNHKLQLYRENINELQYKDAIRARAFLTSAILLTASLLVLLALIFVLSKLQLSYGLAPNSHLIAFLPEECAAELGALKRHMEKKKASVWHIRLRLLQEFLMLLWVFYIQVKIENLGLPPSDRSTDD